MFSLILKTFDFPLAWKTSICIPIHKSENKTYIENYRNTFNMSPNCPTMWKMQLVNNNTVLGLDNGSMPNYLQLQTMPMKFSRKNKNWIPFSQISQAFDRINHDCRLQKFNKFVLSKGILKMLSNYVNDTDIVTLQTT